MRPIYMPASATAGDSAAVILDKYLDPTNVLLTVELYGGTGGSYTVYYSPDDPFATYTTSYTANANWYAHPTLVTLSADGTDQMSIPAQAVKLTTVTPATGSTQTPRLVVIQAGGHGQA